MAKLATPALSGAFPSTVVPSSKVTVPVGVSVELASGVTFAVRVTVWPAVEVLGDAARVVVLAWITGATF